MADTSPEPVPNPTASRNDATALLERAAAGDREAAEALLPMVYDQLRAIAGSLFRKEASEHTLQPTALVHEAYVKLVNKDDKPWESAEHFCAVASIAMRQVLTDHARAKRALKRGGSGREREGLSGIASTELGDTMDTLVLEEGLTILADVDPEGARVVELRLFGGLSHPQIARILDMSVQAVDRRWRRARALIRSRMSGGEE